MLAVTVAAAVTRRETAEAGGWLVVSGGVWGCSERSPLGGKGNRERRWAVLASDLRRGRKCWPGPVSLRFLCLLVGLKEICLRKTLLRSGNAHCTTAQGVWFFRE